jgi:hypothetical protein
LQERRRMRLTDDLEVEVQAIDPFRGQRLLHRLMQAFAPAFGAVMKGNGEINLKGVNLDNIGPALATLFDRFSADDQEDVVKQLLGSALLHKDGKQFPLLGVAAVELAGRVDLLYAAAWYALEVNFKSFLPAVPKLLALFTAAEAKAPASTPPTS